MKRENFSKGRNGEELACEYLTRSGYEILERNYRSRTAEIDIIAKKSGVTVFVEVKSRTSGQFGTGYEAVNRTKIGKIKRLAQQYCVRNNLLDAPQRLDVIEVVLGEKPKFTHYENVTG